MDIRNDKNKKRKNMWIFIVLTILFLLIVVYLHVPFSPMKSYVEKTALSLKADKPSNELFTEKDIVKLPDPVKRYFESCGYIGTPKMTYMKAFFKNTDFLLSKDKPYAKNNYTEYVFVKEPSRIALSEIKMFQIPLQAFESYIKGKGRMKGVIAKTFTLFDETGAEMDISSLVTVLSYCLIVPNLAIQNYIFWESIDDTHAKATISDCGISASGIFKFTENGEMISFTTNDRWETGDDGIKTQTPWSVILSDYEEKDGIRHPTSFKVVWHHKNDDLVYFNSNNAIFEFH